MRVCVYVQLCHIAPFMRPAATLRHTEVTELTDRVEPQSLKAERSLTGTGSVQPAFERARARL